ncbi:MAG: hypothetical protein AAFY16_07945 [Cyanobacteria bacterium J06642_3]
MKSDRNVCEAQISDRIPRSPQRESAVLGVFLMSNFRNKGLSLCTAM